MILTCLTIITVPSTIRSRAYAWWLIYVLLALLIWWRARLTWVIHKIALLYFRTRNRTQSRTYSISWTLSTSPIPCTILIRTFATPLELIWSTRLCLVVNLALILIIYTSWLWVTSIQFGKSAKLLVDNTLWI